MVAMNLEDGLTDAGYEVAGPFGACSDAMTWLSTETPRMAVLDVRLKDGACTALAAELGRRDVPFVVYSVSSRTRNTVKEFMNVAWVEKPAPVKAVLAALAEISAGSSGREA